MYIYIYIYIYILSMQYAGVPLTELINENVLSLTTNLSIVPLKSFLTIPAVSVPGLLLCITKFSRTF